MPPDPTQTPYLPEQFLAELKKGLSVERFNAYRTNGDETALDVVGRYAWNMALCEALYPALHVCEVALRNSINRTLRREYEEGDLGAGPTRPNATCWIDDGTKVLTTEHAERVRKVKRRLKHQLGREGKQFTPGKLVAELNFGFWAYLFDSEYGFTTPNDPGLWPRLLGGVFPHLDKSRRQRKTVKKRLHDIRHLRNRAFHHEPIWKIPNPMQAYEHIYEVIGWISPDLAMAVRAVDRFEVVLEDRSHRYLRRSIYAHVTGNGA